jgi:putative addiction module component (TIGR02574 family)
VNRERIFSVMILEKVPDVQRLSEADKWLLIHELWDELLPPPDQEPSEKIVALLDRRMAEYRANPSCASAWDEVKERLRLLRSK